MSKYIIIDNTSNTGKDHIDDNGNNCIEEQAAKYASRAEAERVAQSLTKVQVERWACRLDPGRGIRLLVRADAVWLNLRGPSLYRRRADRRRAVLLRT